MKMRLPSLLKSRLVLVTNEFHSELDRSGCTVVSDRNRVTTVTFGVKLDRNETSRHGYEP